MHNGEAGRSPLEVLVGGACLVVILAGLKAASELLVPLAFSAFLAIIVTPLVFWLLRHRVPMVVSVLLVVLLVLAGLSGLAGVVGGSVNSLVAAAPRYSEGLNALLDTSASWLAARGVELSAARLRGLINPTAAIGLVGGTVSQIASMLSDTLLVLLTVVFMLFEITVLPAKLRTAFGETTADLGRYAKIITEINQYVVLKTYISLATGVLVWLMLSMLGVDFAMLWGLTAFLLNFIPNIGSIVAAVPPVLLSLVQHGVARSLIALSGFVVINMVIGNMVEPRVMGRRLGLSTLVVFLSLLVWGWLWGGMGMLLSVPLTMILKILCENSRSLRWVATLMDDTPADAVAPGAAAPAAAAAPDLTAGPPAE